MMPRCPRWPGQDLLQLLLQRGARQDAVDQIGTIERADQLQRLAQLQLRRDVAAHAAGRGRGEGVQADAGKARSQRAELAVLRTEVVAPLADAVRLVDGDVRDAAEHLQEALAALAASRSGDT
jgi:hypothetical protein